MEHLKMPKPWALLMWKAWLPIGLVALWFIVSADSTSPFWPPLSRIFEGLFAWAESGTLWEDLLFSFGNYLIAIAFAMIAGLGVGVAIGLLPHLARVLDPYLDFLRSMPTVVFVPIIVLVLGIGAWPKVFLIAVACFWPILLNCIEGVRQIAPSVREATRAYRIPLVLLIRKVILPGALPQIVVGIRLAITIGLVMLVVSEMYGSARGIGYFIFNSSQRFRLADAWAGTLLLGVIGWLLTAGYARFERRLLAWHRRDDGSTRKRRADKNRQVADITMTAPQAYHRTAAQGGAQT